MKNLLVKVLLEKYNFDGVGIIEKNSPTFEDDVLAFLSSEKNLVVVILDFSTLEVYGFPWLIIGGKCYNTLEDFFRGFPRGMESQLNHEKIAAKLNGKKVIEY